MKTLDTLISQGFELQVRRHGLHGEVFSTITSHHKQHIGVGYSLKGSLKDLEKSLCRYFDKPRESCGD